MNINSTGGEYAGRFKLQKRSEFGILLSESDWIDNLITDFGLNLICVNTGASLQSAGFLAVGSGSTVPDVTNVALVSQLGPRVQLAAAKVNTNSGSPEYYSASVGTYSYTVGQIAGNIAEVGLFQSSSGNNACTRALVKDSSGNPTTFTVLATEQLSVIYELRFYPNLVDTSGSFNIGATVHSYTQRASYATGEKGAGLLSAAAAYGHLSPSVAAGLYAAQALPAFGVGPTGTRFNSTSFTLNSYTVGTFTRRETVTWNPASGNVPGGIGFIHYGAYSDDPSNNQGFFLTVSPVIPKTNLQTLNLVFDISYGRKSL